MSKPTFESPRKLMSELERAGLSVDDVARVFGVTPRTVRGWLAGRHAAPAWLRTGLILYRQLSPAARRAALREITGKAQLTGLRRRSPSESGPLAAPNHPFARIEDL